MLRLFFILRRKPGISAEDFHSHWKNVHGPLVSRLPGLVRYIQHHVVSMPRAEYAQVDEPVDGIVETWWESEEALGRVQGSPELLAVMEDEKVFMGHTNHFVHTLVVTESVPIVDRAGAA